MQNRAAADLQSHIFIYILQLHIWIHQKVLKTRVNVIQVLPSTLQECLEVFQLYMLYTAYICKQLKIKASSKTFLFGSLSQLLYVLLPKVQQAFLRMCTRLGLADLRLNCYCCCFCCVLKICTQNWVHKLHKFSSP